MFELNPFTGEAAFSKPENKTLGFYTDFSCGVLAGLDLENFSKINCGDLPICCNKRKIDLGDLNDGCN